MPAPLVEKMLTPVEFRVSLYGRFHDAITTIVFLLFMAPVCAAAFSQEEKFSWGALGFFGIFFLGSLGMGAYSLFQLLRRSPRFILDAQGFMYRGFVLRFQSDWSNVISYRLGGFHGYDFLEVQFAQSPARFRNNIRLDVSRLTPDKKELMGIFRKYVPRGDRTLFP